MPDYSFDRFLDGVSDVMAHAQATGRRLRQRLLQRQFGCSDEKVATFSVPTWGGDGWRTLEIPMVDLMQRSDVGVSELELELDCELRLQPAVEAEGVGRVALCIGYPGVHKLRIKLRGIQAPRGKVFLDDVLLRRFSGADEADAHDRSTSPVF